MNSLFARLYHLVTAQPVAHRAWAALTLSLLVLIVLALPGFWHAIRIAYHRAHIYLAATLLSALVLAIGLEWALAGGYRFPLIRAAASESVAVPVARLYGSGSALTIAQYYRVMQNLDGSRGIGAIIPLVRVSTRWTDLRTSARFPGDLDALNDADENGSTSTMGRGLHSVAGQRVNIAALGASGAYVGDDLAAADGVLPGDVLVAHLRGQPFYVRVAALVEPDYLGLPDAVFVALPALQLHLRLGDTITAIVVEGAPGTADKLTRIASRVAVTAGFPRPRANVYVWKVAVKGEEESNTGVDSLILVSACMVTVCCATALRLLGRSSQNRTE